MTFLVYESDNHFVTSVNGEQLKVIHGANAVYVQRWTGSGWRPFIQLPALPKAQAKQRAVEISLTLSGELPDEKQRRDYNGRHRPPETADALAAEEG